MSSAACNTVAGGGATLPDDWKYRLGEQLKTNMGHAPPASPSSKEEMKPQKAQVEAPSNGALIEPLTITPTIDAPKSMKQHSNPALENASSNRWVDTPPGPASPGKEMKDQMKVDKQTYVNGDVIEPPKVKLNKPPTQASANPLASPAAKPSPGVQVAAEDLRTSNSTTPVKAEAGEKEGAKASPPPKVDKMKEKVDSFIAQKASPPATDPKASPPRASASAPASAKSKPSSTPHSVARPSKVSPESQAVEPPPPKSPPHTHDSTSPPQPPQPPQQHTHDTNNFGSMEMGLLMAGG
ncbi:hypothetical protein SLS60_001135 [Paraconiothyrium brasiliense]|uniref:Uncharacterized protein n=1 Tax=Paraconiothyrium brasiliense TaxID=300254 RepID=A0ABR3S894_9PLEO